MEELSALPYLDAAVRECLRLNSPNDVIYRMAAEDCAIPISEPFIDRQGMQQSELRWATFRILKVFR